MEHILLQPVHSTKIYSVTCAGVTFIDCALETFINASAQGSLFDLIFVAALSIACQISSSIKFAPTLTVNVEHRNIIVIHHYRHSFYSKTL